MVVRSLDMKNDPFHPYKKSEEFGPKVPYFSVIGPLMYSPIVYAQILFFYQLINKILFYSNSKTLE